MTEDFGETQNEKHRRHPRMAAVCMFRMSGGYFELPIAVSRLMRTCSKNCSVVIQG